MTDADVLNNRDAMIYVLWRGANRLPRVSMTLGQATAIVDEMMQVAPGIVAGAYKAWRGIQRAPRRGASS